MSEMISFHYIFKLKHNLRVSLLFVELFRQKCTNLAKNTEHKHIGFKSIRKNFISLQSAPKVSRAVLLSQSVCFEYILDLRYVECGY